MILKDFHTHTDFCDGKNTPEEMIQSAYARNMESIGIATHSYTFFDESYCIKKDEIQDFLYLVHYLKDRYSDYIEVKCGVEQDYYSTAPTEGFDYIIGSVHYLKVNDEYIPVDESAEISEEACNKYFGGDYYAMAECYFNTVADVAEKTNCDIIGHFDLICKFNEVNPKFDEKDERYVNAWKAAVDKLIPAGKPFEINTGAISRGYKTCAYPSPDMIEYIRVNGGSFILSSDSHDKDTLCFDFDKYEQLI